MTVNTFCKELSGESCSLVGEKCFRIRAGSRCEYIGYYELLKDIARDTPPPIAAKARASIITPLLESWKNYAQNPRTGMKIVVALPLEREIRAILKSELEPLGVVVHDTGTKYRIWENVAIIADGLAQKEGFPTSIISVKTWIAEGQIRETFAYAYWAKTWLGRKQVRVYEVAILKTPTKGKSIESLIEICKPYLDGVFYLTEAPYIDELIKELKEIYSKHKP